MSRLRTLMAFSFRAKVLLPVIAVMVVLMAVTTLIVDLRMNQQVDLEARTALGTADEAFREFQNFRTKTLLMRFRDLPGEPYYRAAFQTLDAATLREPLNTMLAQQGVDLVLFNTDQKLVASAKRDPLVSILNFESASAPLVSEALQGEERVETIRVGDKLYDMVSIPVLDADSQIYGALTLGCEIGLGVTKQLSQFSHSQIVLMSDERIMATTISALDPNAFVELFKDLSVETVRAGRARVVEKKIISGEHFYCFAGRFSPAAPDNAAGYLLLYSYEQQARALESTRQILLATSSLTILLGAAIVCVLVGKITRPLRELRESAEAVGRGDFSRRVRVRYDDECGELAIVFNRMTENLQTSREQLEMTVDTLKTTQAQLVQSEKLSGIGEFVAGVAHELNNPLTAVMGFADLLRRGNVDVKNRRYVDMIHKSAMRCQKIVQALLSFARRRGPERKPICANRLVEAAIEILQYQLRTSNIEIITKLDPQLPQAVVDPHQIQQVFVNIINNARQAIESQQPKGWIKITSDTRGHQVRVTIQDSGPGIPEDCLAKIFDPFFTTKEVGQGTGLGLSLCYGIIKEHGGTITPRSKPGEGATFVIELPITDAAVETVAEAPAVDTEITHRHEGRGKKVLVIDDEEPILQMVRETLAPRGYEVDAVLDGESALRRLKEKKYDLALCDWKMPGLNGQEVYERLRATNPTLSERVIFITGDVINDKTRKYFEDQHKVCLSKPFTLKEFCAAVRKALQPAAG